jgi:hypothetical protein
MYIGVDWEVVNSISGIYTPILVPNLRSTLYISMYTSVQWLIIITVLPTKTWALLNVHSLQDSEGSLPAKSIVCWSTGVDAPSSIG